VNRYYFNLKAANGKIILTSDLLGSSAGIIDGAAESGSKDYRSLATLIRSHREVLAETC
jgi:hypothetical protein